MKKDLLKNNPAIGMSWEEFEKEYFTPEEIAASDLRVAIIGELIKARREKGLTQKELENITGIKQPVIARIEKGTTNPQIARYYQSANSNYFKTARPARQNSCRCPVKTC